MAGVNGVQFDVGEEKTLHEEETQFSQTLSSSGFFVACGCVVVFGS